MPTVKVSNMLLSTKSQSMEPQLYKQKSTPQKGLQGNQFLNAQNHPVMHRGKSMQVKFGGDVQGANSLDVTIGGLGKAKTGINFDQIEEISHEEGMEFNNRLEQFVEYFKVQDRAILGRLTNMVRIKDPSTGLLIASIRDPKVDINPYSSMRGVVDMQDAIIKGEVPIFNPEVAPMSFDIRRLGWHTMLDLIKHKESKKQFWEFIERLRIVREKYNQILLNKFTKLPKTLRRNLEV